MARTPKPVDPTAVEQSVSVSLPIELVARLDAAASERVVGRGFLLRYFIEQGMANLPALPASGVLGPALTVDVPTGHVIINGVAVPFEPTKLPESLAEASEPSTGLLEG